MKIMVEKEIVGEVVEVDDCKSCHDNTPYITLNNKIIKVKWLTAEMQKKAYDAAITFNQKEAILTGLYSYRVSDFVNHMKLSSNMQIVKVNENIYLKAAISG